MLNEIEIEILSHNLWDLLGANMSIVNTESLTQICEELRSNMPTPRTQVNITIHIARGDSKPILIEAMGEL